MKWFVHQQWFISALAVSSVLYGLVVLWFVPTQPCVPLGCLLCNTDETQLPGLEIQDVSWLRESKGSTPALRDHVIEVAGRPVRSFSDWSRIHRQLRNWKIDRAAILSPGKDPSEESAQASLPVFEYQQPDMKFRYVSVWFLRPGETSAMYGGLQLIAPPTLGFSMTLFWFVLQLCVIIAGGVAYWNRPFDQPLRIFVVLSSIAMVAFVGGSHWWVIAASPLLVTLFAIAAILLPAVLLHFFLVYPFPSPMIANHRWLSRGGLYLLPGLAALLVSTLILSAAFLSRDLGPGPFAESIEHLLANAVNQLLLVLRKTIFVTFGLSLVYFLLSLLAIRRGLLQARNALERNQVQSIYLAALAATVPIGYTIYLAIYDLPRFALGAAQFPMFLASLAFMLAYGVGIARYKLMLIDQVVSRGVWYYGVSAGLAVIFAALISVGAVNALNQDLSLFGRTVPLVLVLMTSVLVLSWGRDALQRSLDRRYFSEKYQLDKALRRMDRVVSNALEPEAVAERLLSSCGEVLHVEQAAFYLRRKDRPEFRMAVASGRADFPLQIALEPAAIEALTENIVLQRVPHSGSPAQSMLRQLRAEVVHGLEIQGILGGLLVFGAKPNNSPFSAEDLAFLSAMARITSVALHCSIVQQDVARLNQDLTLKVNKIEDQGRQISALQHELATISKLPNVPGSSEEFHRTNIMGHGPSITQVLETVRKVASSNSSVLIRGESGTGKELLARALHENSPRRQQPLVSVHCAALTPSLLESELFGHVQGAFTDARHDKLGRFQMADGGTLFLDEIGEISLDVQVKLLRVLQERTFEPVGGTKSVTVDVRIVAATHRNLEQLITQGKFREDLYYRLNVISVTLPPLRERQEDLFELALHFLRQASEKSGRNVLKIDDDAFHTLQSYHWPGNIRELQNVIERAVVLAEGNSVRLIDLPADLRSAKQSRSSQSEFLPRVAIPGGGFSSPPTQIALRRKILTHNADERASLLSALAECGGNKAEAARLLEMPRSTFFSKLKKHGIS